MSSIVSSKEAGAPGAGRQGLPSVDVEKVVERATKLVAPLWPLETFVAVNPFLGLADRSFPDAARAMAEA